MPESILKYFAIIYSSRYFYNKIQNIIPSKVQRISNILFSLFLAVGINFTRKIISPITFPLIILLSIIFSLLLFRQSAYINIISNIISIGMSNILSLFSLVICTFFSMLLCKNTSIVEENTLLYFTVYTILQLLLMTLPFKFHRLKKGIPNLNNAKFCSIGITISLVSILITSIFTPQTEPRNELIIILLILPFCGILIIVWWKNRITDKYIKEVHKRAFTSLKNELMEKKNQITYLTKENNELSSIIHKNNKLIPSMELAITELINSVINNPKKDALLTNAEQILLRLKAMSKERYGILENYEHRTQKIATTNIITIDSLMMYMLKKADAYSINFDVKTTGDFDFLKNNSEFESDLLTMLADVIENAIIATKSSVEKNIAVHFTNNDCFSIEIYDSGVFFDEKLIQNLGIKKTTSHKNDGGSGIGLMTLIFLIKKHAATLMIEEFTKNTLYKKKVSLLFNKETTIIIRTNRKNLLSLKKERNDIQFETLLETST